MVHHSRSTKMLSWHRPRRVEPVEEVLQMPGHLLSAGQKVRGQRRQPIPGVKIGQVVKMKRAARRS
jgi:hypothetical protein